MSIKIVKFLLIILSIPLIYIGLEEIFHLGHLVGKLLRFL